jgi:hypothetical protein
MFGETVLFAPAVRYSRVLSRNILKDIKCKAMLVYFVVTVGIVLLAPQLHIHSPTELVDTEVWGGS